MKMFNPAGLRILVVDDDPLCLAVLQRMLKQCHYTVAACDNVNKALAMLREGGFDIVMSEAYLPNGDGFKLLQKIGLELDLPVIMMSSNAETAIVMKGIIHGACDYLVKPIRMQELRNIWQHVFRRMGQNFQSGGEEEEDEEDIQIIQSPAEGFGLKKRKDQAVDFSSNLEGEQVVDDISGLKKARVIWSAQLHKQFVKAVNELGVDNAMPKRIVEIMNVQGLTRENVASHLQKYRLYLKRVNGLSDASSLVASFQASKHGINTGMRRLNLVSLSEYDMQEQQHVANRGQELGVLGLVDSMQINHKDSSNPPYSPLSSSSSPSSFSPPSGWHRTCSLDSQNFLTAHPEETSMEQTFSHSSDFAFKMGNSKLPTRSRKSLHKKGTKEAFAPTSRWIERTYSGSHIQELGKIRSLMLASLENKVTDIVKMDPIQKSASSFVSKSVDSSCASSNISRLSATSVSIPLLTEEGMKDDALSMVNLNSFSSIVLPDTCGELVPRTPLDISDYVIDGTFY